MTESSFLLSQGYNLFIKKFQNNSNDDSLLVINLVVIHGGPALNTHENMLV